LECVVGAQSDSYICLLENVRNKGGLPAEVCEGGPFMCGFFFLLLAGGCSRLSRGGMCVCVCVCVYRKPIVPHDVVDGVQFFKFVVLQVVGVQSIV